MKLYRLVFLSCFLQTGIIVNAQEWLVPADKRVKLSPFKFNDSTRLAGKTVFEANCVSCHGSPGKANFNNALVPPPPDPVSDQMQHNTDGDLFYKISEGRGQMPKFKDILSPDEIWGVISYMRSFNKDYLQQVQEIAQKTGYGGTIKILLEFLADSNQLKTTVLGTKENKTAPLEGVGLKLFAQRYFGNLPLDEERSTGKDGSVIFNLPSNIPGDPSGGVRYAVFVADQELYGKVFADTLLNDGIPVDKPGLLAKRSLYNKTHKAPIWLLITYTSGVVVAWGVIFYILFLIRRIYKIGNRRENDHPEQINPI